MDSDSESGVDYETSDDERIAQIKETSSTGEAKEGGTREFVDGRKYY